MKRIFCVLLALSVLLPGCMYPQETQTQPPKKQYNATFLTLFDTVTTIVGKSDSQDTFTAQAQAIHDELLVYHQLFDIYNEYEGLNNLKTVNDSAGIAPVKVDGRIIRLLKDCLGYYELTGGRVNPLMGSVLSLWHESREDGFNDPQNARLPEQTALEQASLHTDPRCIVIDESASTVYLSDPDARLDVGAVAKGWSVQRVCENTPSGLLISVGGNVCATGAKDESGTPWVVGIQEPQGGEQYLHTLYLTKGSVVTSGDYQRCYVVDGELYHHIIDPDTLYPSRFWRSVTIVCDDSALADALSTALFLLPLEEGMALAAQCGAEVLWVDRAEQRFYSPGFEELIRT